MVSIHQSRFNDLDTDDDSDLSDPEDDALARNLMSYIPRKRPGHGSVINRQPPQKRARTAVASPTPRIRAVRNGIPPIRIPRARYARDVPGNPEPPKESSTTLFNAGKQIFSWALTKFWDPSSAEAPLFEQKFSAKPDDNSPASDVSMLTDDGETDSESIYPDETQSSKTADLSSSRYNLRRPSLQSFADSFMTNDSDGTNNSHFLTPKNSPEAERSVRYHQLAYSVPARATTRGILSPRKGGSSYKPRVRVSINRTPRIREIANRIDQAVDGSLVWSHRDLAPHECEQYRTENGDSSPDASPEVSVNLTGADNFGIPDKLTSGLRFSFSSGSSQENSPGIPAKSTSRTSSIQTRSSTNLLSPRSEMAKVLLQFGQQEKVFEPSPLSFSTNNQQTRESTNSAAVPAPKFLRSAQLPTNNADSAVGGVTKQIKLPRLMPRRVRRDPVEKEPKKKTDEATLQRLKSYANLDYLLTVKPYNLPWLPPLANNGEMDDSMDQSETWEDQSTEDERYEDSMGEDVQQTQASPAADSSVIAGNAVSSCPTDSIEPRKRLSFNGGLVDPEVSAQPHLSSEREENPKVVVSSEAVAEEVEPDAYPETFEEPLEDFENELPKRQSVNYLSSETPRNSIQSVNEFSPDVGRLSVQCRKPLPGRSPVDLDEICKKYEAKVADKIAAAKLRVPVALTEGPSLTQTADPERLREEIDEESRDTFKNDDVADEDSTSPEIKRTTLPETRQRPSSSLALRRSERNRTKKVQKPLK